MGNQGNNMSWDIEKSKLIYGISRDDLNFLDIDSQGDLVVNISETSINIKEIISKVKLELSSQTDFKVPSFTLRLPQLIGEQTKKIISTFNKIITENNYSGIFRPLYPIKVNHRKSEIYAVLENDDIYGLEVGTKSFHR